MIVLSAFQAEKILQAINKSESNVKVSLDLGITKSIAEFDNNASAANSTANNNINNYKIILTHKAPKAVETEAITIDDLKKIIKNNKVCYLVKNNAIHKIQLFSTETNTFLKLFPTGEHTAPTIELSGIRMHNIKEQDPLTDANNKINAINVHGKVLDTCFGLGYTAITAAKKNDAAKNQVTEVYTHERDPNIVEVAKHNPWSNEVFTNKKINLKICDTVNEIKNYKNEFFDTIIHDPPMFRLSSEMYSQEFYNQLFRVLKKSGELYHYIGAHGTKNRNIDLTSGAIKRLEKAGFKDIKRKYNGIAARK